MGRGKRCMSHRVPLCPPRNPSCAKVTPPWPWTTQVARISRSIRKYRNKYKWWIRLSNSQAQAFIFLYWLNMNFMKALILNMGSLWLTDWPPGAAVDFPSSKSVLLWLTALFLSSSYCHLPKKSTTSFEYGPWTTCDYLCCTRAFSELDGALLGTCNKSITLCCLAWQMKPGCTKHVVSKELTGDLTKHGKRVQSCNVTNITPPAYITLSFNVM